MKNPREFWLTEHSEYDQWSAHDHEQYDDDTHVIEKQAYDEVVGKYSKLTEKYSNLVDKHLSLKDQAEALASAMIVVNENISLNGPTEVCVKDLRSVAYAAKNAHRSYEKFKKGSE